MLNNLKQELRQVISEFPALKIHIYLGEWETDFLRFYQSQTNYNISKHSLSAGVSLYKDKKSYSFTVNNPTAEAVRQKITEALPIIDKLPPDPHFVDLEKDLRKGAEAPVDNNIQKLDLEKKVEILKQFRDAVQPYDFDIYGTFICNYEIGYIINSNGVDKKVSSSPYYLEVKAVSNKNEVTVLHVLGGENVDDLTTPYPLHRGEELSGLHRGEIWNSLVEKVKVAQNSVIDVPAGEYDVILAPRCVGDLMTYYTWSNLTGSSLDQKDTHLEGKIGEQIFPAYFTLKDCPHYPAVVRAEYSDEGHLLSELPIFEQGVFKNFFMGSYFANKLNMTENGNSGSCLVMQTGDTSLEDMIKSVKRGLYISSFHYINFINNRETSLTGLTRDGTFLIEDGKLTKVINNLRFTDKIIDVINNITAIENQGHTIPTSDNYGAFSISACSMPHIRVKGFKISSSTHTV